MDKRYNYELIRDYLDGTLESASRTEVEQLIREDEVAKNIARGILILDEHFQKNEEEIDRYLGGLLSRRTETINASVSTSKRFPYFKIAAAFTLLLIASIIVYNFSSPNLEEYLEAQLSQPYQAPSISRSVDDMEDDFMLGITYYQDQEYEKAYTALSSVDSPVSIFYRGLSKLYLSDYDKSIEILKSDELKASIFYQHSKWYLSLSYLKTGQVDKAVTILNELSETGYKHEEAKNMLDLLD